MTISKKSAFLLYVAIASSLVLFAVSYFYPVPKLAFAGLTIVTALVYTLFIRLAILRPLEEFSGALKGASAVGDLTKRLKVRGGEMGGIAKLFNSFMDEIMKTVGEAKSAADLARRAASEVTLTMDASYKGAMGVSGRVKDVSANIEEQARGAVNFEEISARLLNNYEYLSAQISEASDAIDKITFSKEAGERNLAALMEKHDAEAGGNRKTASELGSLNWQINQMGQIVGEIKDAAARTDFLSRGAASEASGAGEYGKGFTVVADAISAQAGRSADAASGLEKIAASMGISGSSGAEAMDGVIKISEERGEYVRKIRYALSEISSEISAVNSALGGAHNVLAALASENAKIREGMRGIQDLGLENKRRVESVDESVSSQVDAIESIKDLSDKAASTINELKGTLDRFEVEE